MNNLKRVLSLGLAGTMLTGMMVVGASAAGFTDADEIVNTDAVDTMVALNIINGKDDGSYDPKGLVTRAEMAKMIATAMNGGQAPTLGVKNVPTYTDIKGHWAEQYIEYCADLKIINGRGNGTFDPNGNVTGVEAAKMMLTALNYDATAFQLTGADWAINTNYEATWSCDPSLYEDLNGVNLNAPLTRDNAAQLIWNGVQNQTMSKRPDKTLSTGEVTYSYDKSGTTLLKLKYNAEIGYGFLTGSNYDEDKDVYEYELSTDAFGTTAEIKKPAPKSVSFDNDVSDLFGQQVKVVYDAKTEDVYGIFANDSSVLYSGIVADLPSTISGTSIKVDGTTYKTNGDAVAVKVYSFNETEAEKNGLNKYEDDTTAPYNMALIDNDDDGKVNCVVVYPFEVKKVTSVSKSSFTVGGKSYKFDEVTAPEDLAKNDWVKITAAENTVDGNKAFEVVDTIVDGKITSTKDGGKQFRIDGTWYTAANGGTVTAGTTASEVVVVNGYAFNIDTTSSVDVSDYALVLKAEGGSEGGIDGARAQLLFTDGTKKVVSTKENYGDKEYGYIGKLVTYKVDDDEYTLTPAPTKADGSGFDSVVSGTYKYASSGKSTINGNYIADDAVIFVKTGDGKGKVVTGAALAKTNGGITVKNAYANTSSSTGFGTIQLAYVEGTISSSDYLYGYIVSSIETVENDDDDLVCSFTLFNGEENIEVETSDKAADLKNLKKGAFVIYTEDGNAIDVKYAASINKIAGESNWLTEIGEAPEGYEVKVAALTGVRNDEVNLAAKRTSEEIDVDGKKETVWALNAETSMSNLDTEDAVIVGVNVEDVEGVPGIELALAEKTPGGNNYYANALVIKAAGENKTVYAIFYCNDLLQQMP